MQTNIIENGLLQLGFNTGWVVNGDEIVLWENPEPQPTMETILQAAKDYVEPTPTVEQKLASVGLSIDDLKVALGLGGN
jgi:MOSC domain-containing protein YiiM